MNPDDQAARLRRALGVLGDAAMPPASFEQLSLRNGVPDVDRAPRRFVLAGALVALIVIAAVALMWTARSRPGAVGDSRTLLDSGRIYAIPLEVPTGMALTEAGTSDFSGAFDAAPDRHAVDVVVEYASASGSVKVVSGRAEPRNPLAGSDIVTLPGGPQVEVAGDLEQTRLRWVQPGGPVVLIVANNVELDEVLAVASSMWFVTPDVWARLAAHAGFRTPHDAVERSDLWRPPGPGHAEVFVAGSLQTGLRVSFGRGSTLSVAPTPVEECRAVTLDQRTFLLIGPPGTKSFTITDSNGGTSRLESASPPGLPAWPMATLETSRQQPTLDVTCSEAGS